MIATPMQTTNLVLSIIVVGPFVIALLCYVVGLAQWADQAATDRKRSQQNRARQKALDLPRAREIARLHNEAIRAGHYLDDEARRAENAMRRIAFDESRRQP